MDPIFTQQFNMPPPQAPKGGMFGGGDGKFGIAQAIAAALNGFLAGGQGPGREVGLNNMQMMAAMRQRALEHQQSLEDYNRKRADDNTDWTQREQWQLDHKPPEQGEQERLLARYMDPNTPPQEKAVIGQVLMPPTLQMVNGSLVSVPRAPQDVPTSPVGNLKPYNPGGPASQAPGGFPNGPYSNIGPYPRY